MKKSRYPKGWNEARVQRVLEHYERQGKPVPRKRKRLTRARTPVYRYEILIYWSGEDRTFIAEIPELPGCMADGATYREAVAAAEKAMALWIDTAKETGREIPPPQDRRLPA